MTLERKKSEWIISLIHFISNGQSQHGIGFKQAYLYEIALGGPLAARISND
ncbi:hypothetical protein [Enterococcus mundtii]|uniref:hypothetical protein n=1 Tax=Enterococcus mundtii TaxID=53346 RepID=UPI0035C6FD70